MKPRALDLYCGAGGVSKGLRDAGFDVIGIDVRRQRRYPWPESFIQADCLALPVRLESFDFVWASPPCQRYVTLTKVSGSPDDHPDLIEPTRELISGHGLTCIENVYLAPLRMDLVLDGGMFGLNTWRQRKFELSFFSLQPGRTKRFGPVTRPGSVSVCGSTGGAYYSRYNGTVKNGNIHSRREAMGIDWMVNSEIVEAVPPVYAEFIGRAALQQLGL